MKLGEILIKYNLINQEQLDQALELQKLSGKKLGTVLLQHGWVTEDDMNYSLSQQLDIPYVHMTLDMVDQDLVNLFPSGMLNSLGVLPLHKNDSELTIATSDPTDTEALDLIAKAMNCTVIPALAKASEIRTILDTLFGIVAVRPQSAKPQNLDSLCRPLLESALQSGATHIDIYSVNDNPQITFSYDGNICGQSAIPGSKYRDIVEKLSALNTIALSSKNDAFPHYFSFQHKELFTVKVFAIETGSNIRIALDIYPPVKTLDQIKVTNLSDIVESDIHKLVTQKSRGIVLISATDPASRMNIGYYILQLFKKAGASVGTIEPVPTVKEESFLQIHLSSSISISKNQAFKYMADMGIEVVLYDSSENTPQWAELLQAVYRGALIIVLLPCRDAEETLHCLEMDTLNSESVYYNLRSIIASAQIPVLCGQCQVFDKHNHPIKGPGCDQCKQTGYKEYQPFYEVITQRMISTPGMNLKQTIQDLNHIPNFISIRQQTDSLQQKGLVSLDDIIRKLGVPRR